MTDTHTTDLTEQHDSGNQQMPDPRPMVVNALAISQRLIDGVRPDQLDHPTPCPDFTVRDLIAHMLFVVDRIAAVGTREPAASADFQMAVEPSAAGATHGALANEVEAVWADDARLGEMCDLEWAVLPGAVALSIYVNEFLVHGWDLAVATGQQPDWDDATVAFALASMHIGLPADGRDQAPFGEVVSVPADAELISQLVAWNGRNPN